MRNLKKVLSLVLVVAMLASMLIVGAAAAEAVETTNYEEAADVILGIGVMEGDETGMRYGDTVTREEAAAIICRVLLGSTAEELKTGVAPFADVAANRWSAGYISYLKGQGVISGVTDTTFDPTAKVTGIAFAKMLLTAVGYGKNGEFEGADWDINTITYANDNGVFSGSLAADLAAAATREECMLYAFNVLTGVPVVKYNKTFESYYTGLSALDPVSGSFNALAPADSTDPYYYTLAWSKFMLCQVTGEYTDNFGRPAVTWSTYGQVIADAVTAMEPVAVLSGSVYSKDLYTALGKGIIKNLNENIYYVGAVQDDPNTPEDETAAAYMAHPYITVYVDGVEQAKTYSSMSKTYVTDWTTIAAGEYLNQLSATGAHVELYLSADLAGDYYLDVVVWYEHIGDVTKVDAANELIYIDGTRYVYDEAAGFEKKDVVLYTIGGGIVGSVEHVDPVVGTFTGTDWLGASVIDGVGKSISAVNDNVSLEIGYAYEFYYDSLGTILRADEYDTAGAAGTYQYLYVKDAAAQGFTGTLLDGKDAKIALNVTYANGGAEVVYYAVKYSANDDWYYITIDGNDYVITKNVTTNPTNSNNVANIKGELTSANLNDQGQRTKITLVDTWFSYTKNADGEVTLKSLNNTYANAVENTINVVSSRATIGGISGYTANSKTVLTVVDAKGNAATYTGIGNFPIKDYVNADALYTYGANSKVLKNVTIYTDVVPTDALVGYCAFLWSTDANGYTYMFYVDGVPTMITLEDSLATSPFDQGTGKVYDLTYENGAYTTDKNHVAGAYTNTVADTDEGVMNGGLYGVFNGVTFTYDYVETATIDTIDDGFFTTTAIEQEDWDDSNYKKWTALLGGATDYATWQAFVGAQTVYFDANTAVYDVSGGSATEISEGDVFIAYIDEDASAAYNGAQYASIIWIIA